MADTELSSRRAGTSLTFGVGDGSDKGTAYAQEFLYWDKNVSDRSIVYLKGDTQIAMAHNEFNNAALLYSGSTDQYYRLIGENGLDATPGSGDEGIIRFRVDRYWQDRFCHGGHREATGLVGNSVTVNDFGTGSKSWTLTDTTKPSFAVGMRLRASRKSSTLPNATVYRGAWMEGAVTAWNSTTGALTIDVDLVRGSLTGVDLWRITVAAYQPYTGPFTFNDLEYEAGVAVVGTTGPNVSPVTSRASHYYRGVVDEFGDEWHTLCVGHDDEVAAIASNAAMKEEYFASDGRDHVFVLNPKTPCLVWRVTGNGQFWTSRPCAYHIPNFTAQETVIIPGTGSVTCEIVDINGNNVAYRIVTSLGSSTDYTSAGAATVTLTDADFPSGTSYLQYYFAGGLVNLKTRIVRKNPTHPSLIESHGNRLWGNSTEFARISARLSRDPYFSVYQAMKVGDDYLAHDFWDLRGTSGHRWPWFKTSPSWQSQQLSFGGAALTNAFIALIEGWSATRSGKTLSYGQYAKEMVLHQPWARVDPVGFESNHSSGSHASTEVIGAGYYAVKSLLDSVYAYDILAGNFLSTQVSGGLSVCEDYYVRECFAAAALQGAMNLGGQTFMQDGMWGNSRTIAACIIGMMMPEYSSKTFGTSGHGSTTDTYYLTPYRDVKYTWKQLFNDRGLTKTAWPNLKINFNPETDDLWRSNGDWGGNNLGYCGLMMPIYQDLFNMWAIHSTDPTTAFPRVALGMMNAVTGVLYRTPRATASYLAVPLVANAKFSLLGPASLEALETRGTVASEIQTTRVRGLMWIDDELETGGGSGSDVAPAITLQPVSQTITEGQPVTFTITASGSPFPTYQWQKNTVNIPGQTNSTLTFIVAPADAGSYRCVATNPQDSATSNAATLTVIPLPTPPPAIAPKRTNPRSPAAAFLGL